MFAVNDYVFYGSSGICKIVDIQTAPLDGMPKDREYYILHSVHDVNGVMYVPVDSDCIFLRALITRAEAENLLEQISQIAVIDEVNAKLLREKYNVAMRSHQPVEWVRVLKTVTMRMNEPRPVARRISETERSFAENARKYLYHELSLVLGVSLQEIQNAIVERISQNL